MIIIIIVSIMRNRYIHIIIHIVMEILREKIMAIKPINGRAMIIF